ncbi:hypothetical protein LJC36_04760 [Desulfovibrio sp. OttesenSCG-928-C14]|nr:hypothetical protein [Desulfovibrio sp. OttesenSCG-928-C14]
MKKLLLLSLALVFAFSATAFAAEKKITISNKSNEKIICIEVAPNEEGDWITLYQSDKGVEPGKSITLTFDRQDIVLWRIFIETERDENTWDEMNLRKYSKFTFSYDEDDDGYLEWR